MNVKTQFSIKDLEHLSGIKAHTIRIWEKRYNLLTPQRTDTNIRHYDIDNLKRLLNVTFLYNEGHKISKIANLSEADIQELVESIAINQQDEIAIKDFKSAMFDFDEALFQKTYNTLLATKTFRHVFFNVFIPLLNEIGILWQTSTIDPCHESFISELLKRKLIVAIEQEEQVIENSNDPLFVLFLPYNEIHEMGLLYSNYELKAAGYKTLYFGANTPLESLKTIQNSNKEVIFVTYITIQPEGKDILDYLHEFQETTCNNTSATLWLQGAKPQKIKASQVPPNTHIIKNLQDFITKLEGLRTK
ncbi:MerR family transcriptional regulator [Ulvibacter litoralis]|uniref:B12 binding domain-containing protein n=1 Tax=Ulvibacter litoralis TaxID=227084 RepID=A0A1G7JE43_9FLAO|nr:MerR family transcriptional regulator [Ulvibacter litoralis]GHC64729.1 MerR family transcriptional regulator [Ulvibacter litoralis]SDF23054.1 B12 binding domain-containing protein [Ulvibacter litoralis]